MNATFRIAFVIMFFVVLEMFWQLLLWRLIFVILRNEGSMDIVLVNNCNEAVFTAWFFS